MMLSALMLAGSLLAADASPEAQLVSVERFYAGGFRSVRGVEFHGVGPLRERYYAGGFRSARGFAFRGVGPSTGEK